MKFELQAFYLIILCFLIINYSNEEQIEVSVIAKTGIINKNLDAINKEFSFEIYCEVNQNITNNITKIDVSITVKNLDNSQMVEAICHMVPIRLTEDNNATTNFLCIIDLSRYNHIKEDSNLIIHSGPTQDTSDTTSSAIFNFEKFDEISQVLNVGDLTLNYLKEDYCKNNHFFFEIESLSIKRPLLSTICSISLSDDETHPEAKCAIPIIGETIKCYVDVSNTKYKKDDSIIIKSQNLVPCENGQHIAITNDAKNTLTIKEDCGEVINNKSYHLYISKIIFLILILF